jgi:hypothetical protein
MKVLLAILTLASSNAWAWQSPDEALSKFLEFELAGGRLQEWEFNKYLAVGKEHEEPGWDMAVLVKSYSVAPMQCKAGLCSTKVTFQLASTASITSSQVVAYPQGGTESFTFYAVQRSGQWLIGPFNQPPHLSEAAFSKLR